MRLLTTVIHFTLIAASVLTLSSCAMDNLSLPESMGGASRQTNAEQGVRYLFGRGVQQNNEKAFYYFKLAADKGHAAAQNEVAYLYATGKGTQQNYEKALYYYQLAAFQNVASAQFNLGLMYAKGLGTPVSDANARKWIEKSAELGFYPAKEYLHAQTS
jgi:TPR repeat protein